MLKITIAVPTYNRGKSISATLKAIAEQKFPRGSYEIIIVDDGGKDSTKEIVNDFSKKSGVPIKYLWQENRGPAAARNLAIKNSKAPIIAFTDDDCIVHPDWLENIAKAHEKNPDAMIIGGETLPPKGRIVAAVGQGLTKNAFFDYVDGKKQAIFFPTCNASFRREVFDNAGLFDTDFPLAAGEDLEFCWRCFKKGMKLLYQPQIKVTHYCAANLKQYAKQSFNYGRGNYLTKLKQPDHPEIKGIETNRGWRFFGYCIKEFIYTIPFALIFTGRLKKKEKITGFFNSCGVFVTLIVHKISYLAGTVSEHNLAYRTQRI